MYVVFISTAAYSFVLCNSEDYVSVCAYLSILHSVVADVLLSCETVDE